MADLPDQDKLVFTFAPHELLLLQDACHPGSVDCQQASVLAALRPIHWSIDGEASKVGESDLGKTQAAAGSSAPPQDKHTFDVLNRTTLAESAYQRLRAAILDGRMVPGSELNQVALAQEFGISRGPIREALQRLQAERLVSMTPYQQYIVPMLAPQKVAELLELREDLELSLVLRRFDTVDQATLTRLRHLNEGLRQLSDGFAWLEGDLSFHRELCGIDAEGTAIVDEIRSRVQGYLNSVVGDSARRSQACEQHQGIIQALERSDREGLERALRTHIASTRAVVLETLEQSHEL